MQTHYSLVQVIAEQICFPTVPYKIITLFHYKIACSTFPFPLLASSLPFPSFITFAFFILLTAISLFTTPGPVPLLPPCASLIISPCLLYPLFLLYCPLPPLPPFAAFTAPSFASFIALCLHYHPLPFILPSASFTALCTSLFASITTLYHHYRP